MADRENELSPSGGREVSQATGVVPDYYNAWNVIASLLLESDIDQVIAKISSRVPKTYEDYIRGSVPVTDEAQRLIHQSDPGAVIRVDALIGEYTALLEEVKVTKDITKLRIFLKRVSLLIRGYE